jgi:hypothetical protein
MTSDEEREMHVLTTAIGYAQADEIRLADEDLLEDAEQARKAARWMQGRIDAIREGGS